MKRKNNFETFTDGVLEIVKKNGKRSLFETKAGDIHFGEKTVGVTRYWNAQTAGSQVDMLVSIPFDILKTVCITTEDVVIILKSNKFNMTGQYDIVQIQQKDETSPSSVWLSLNKVVHQYKDERNEG